MPQTFPHALVACIRDGRPPLADEIIAVTEKIWRDTGAPAQFSADDVKIAVWLALAGSHSSFEISPVLRAA